MSFSSSPLMESFPSTRFSSPVPSPTRTEVDLPIEVDQSFNSSMSISESPYAFSPSPLSLRPIAKSPLIKSSGIDITSPTPIGTLRPRRPDPVPVQLRRDNSNDGHGLGLSGISTKRTFGRELSVNETARRDAGPATLKAAKGMMGPPAVPEGTSKGYKRGGIPMQWTSSNEEMGPKLFQANMIRRETEPINMISPKLASSENGMDIDSPAFPSRKSTIAQSPLFSGASSLSDSPNSLGSFFCDSPMAPALPPGKRRSLVNGSPASPSSGSPSAKRTSLGQGHKTVSSSAMLFGGSAASSTLAGSRPSTIASRRNNGPYKRPSLLPVPPNPNLPNSSANGSSSSAYPILCGAGAQTSSMFGGNGSQAGTFPRTATAPMRRAFSVCDQGSSVLPELLSEDESEYDNSPSTNAAHAEYARRTGNRHVPRVDGSPGFKPVRASIAATGMGVGGVGAGASPSGKGKKVIGSTMVNNGGLPGFGDNEMDGKILPCHKVKEDGLVRISASTMEDVLQGKYSDKMKRYHVIDCRFDYEFAGGHIDGAINVKSMDALDELLLSEALGVHADGTSLPSPSRSGSLPDGQQVVLIFHCEFSAKRAPTFACHLRARDRTLNGAVYPKIYYPEVYILEGGYSGFFKSHSNRCEPCGYVPMEDPKHSERCKSDLHDFRKFVRTKSYTYGDTSQQSVMAPALGGGSQLAFAAASAAVGRRNNANTNSIVEEDHDHDNDHDEENSSPMFGLIPQQNTIMSNGDYQRNSLPRLTFDPAPAAPIFGSAKTRIMGRAGFNRVQSFAGTTAR